MTIAMLIDRTLEGEGHGASTPDTSVDRWRQEGRDDVTLVEVIAGPPVVVSILDNPRINVTAPPSMQTDYYGRIFVIPEIIDLRNPSVGQPQAYSIWNAFLEQRTLSAVVEVDTDGLISDITPPVVFVAVQVLEFSITVTAAAPITIDAKYTFIFDEGSGVLVFRAERASVFSLQPETPVLQVAKYATDILKAYDGTEQRISVRPEPRQTISGHFIAENDQEARVLRAQLFVGVTAPVVIPLRHEAFQLTATAGLGTFTLTGDFALADWLTDDFLYLESPEGDTFELVKITALTDTTVTIANGLKAPYQVGSRVYPTITGALNDGAGFERYPVNASVMEFRVESFSRRLFGGKGASLDTYQALTLLDRRPLNNTPVAEGFNTRAEKIDFGGAFQVEQAQLFANIVKPLTFLVEDRTDLQFWKLLLDALVGRREPFYLPTFREDLVVAVQPDVGGSAILVTDEPNYVTDWFISEGHRDLVLTNTDGTRLYRRITGALDNADGTITLTLDSALPDTVPGSTIDFIEFLELVRLHSDKVTFQHHGQFSMVRLTTTTTKE